MLSVHTVVSFDFAVAIVPGWHTTIFPPYFVAGAIYSGFAMVLVLAIPIRHFYHFESMITMRHLQNSAKVMLATGLIVAYGYFFETFIAFYSGSTYERFMMQNRWFGPYAPLYWLLILCNIVIATSALDTKGPCQHQVAFPDLAGSSWWACGWSASSLSLSASVATFCPRSGAIIRADALGLCGAGGTIGFFPRRCLSSSASCHPFRSSKCVPCCRSRR